jgi:hypothetical protein
MKKKINFNAPKVAPVAPKRAIPAEDEVMADEEAVAKKSPMKTQGTDGSQ